MLSEFQGSVFISSMNCINIYHLWKITKPLLLYAEEAYEITSSLEKGNIRGAVLLGFQVYLMFCCWVVVVFSPHRNQTIICNPIQRLPKEMIPDELGRKYFTDTLMQIQYNPLVLVRKYEHDFHLNTISTTIEEKIAFANCWRMWIS